MLLLDQDNMGQPSSDCMFCDFKGRITFHLRMSPTCLQKWQKIPYLQMKGSDNAFITKVAVLLGMCPVPYCPEMGGDHKTLPRACVDWWRETGSKILGWRGIDGSTTARAISEKLSNLKKNHKKRSQRSSNGEHGSGVQRALQSGPASTDHGSPVSISETSPHRQSSGTTTLAGA